MARPRIHDEPGVRVYVGRSVLDRVDTYAAGRPRREVLEELLVRALVPIPLTPSVSVPETVSVPRTSPISEPDTRREKVAEVQAEIQRKCPHTVGRSPQGRCFACGHVR